MPWPSSRGRTVLDREGLGGPPANAQVSLSVQKEGFIALVDEVLGSPVAPYCHRLE